MTPDDQTAFTVFPTAIGTCGIAWTARGVVGVWLPEHDADATRARMRRRLGDARECAPPTDVAAAIDGIVALLGGAAVDLGFVVVDSTGVPAFDRRVYDVARRIAPGATRTYGDVAVELGVPNGAQAVGAALGRNRVPVVIPCHRVLAAGGRTGGFSAPGGVATKLRLLAIEGVVVGEQPSLFDG
jgi:methylated-DNA-[protein]-cysteine S-methyltransferase